ncbi:MAG: hypothetical protein GY822_20485 [Deltaproteobacteria bacterium]|nr:hypothetical protein [Deltaproteobacteria bacterium]
MSNVLVEQHLANSRLDQAESIARHAIAINAADVNAHVVLARVDAARGYVERAIESLEDLRKKYKTEPEPLAFVAHFEAARGNWERAIGLAFQCTAMGGEIPVSDVILGDAALKDGNTEEALELYHRALHNHQECAGAWHGRGKVMIAQDELAEAEDALANAVQYGPQLIQAWVDLVVLERDAGATDAAEENLSMALKLHPGQAEFLPLKASLDAIRQQDPLYAVVSETRELLREGDFEGARQKVMFLEAEHFEDERTFLARAEYALGVEGANSDIVPIIHDLNRLIREEPSQWEHKCALGRLFIRSSPLQNPRLAIAQCEDAWQISGQHPRAGIGLIEAWASGGKHIYAKALCEKLAAGEGWEADYARSLLEGTDEDE